MLLMLWVFKVFRLKTEFGCGKLHGGGEAAQGVEDAVGAVP